MTFINLSTLFTTPLNTAALTRTTSFKGSTLPTWQRDFGGTEDSFVSNPLESSFKNKAEIERLAKSNPRIVELCKEYKIPLKVNMEELEALKKGHLHDTRVLTSLICSNLSAEFKKENGINSSDIQQAAMLHDYGKCLIPEKVLNKEGSFTDNEKEIMNLHSEFGYELLKDQGINENVLNLIKYHHQKPDGSGYPEINNGFKPNISMQILEAADMYSALTEERVYHKAYSKDYALDTIKKRVEEKAICPEVFDVLSKIT